MNRIGRRAASGEQLDFLLSQQVLGRVLFFAIMDEDGLIGEQRQKPDDLVQRHLDVLGFHQLFAALAVRVIFGCVVTKRLKL